MRGTSSHWKRHCQNLLFPYRFCWPLRTHQRAPCLVRQQLGCDVLWITFTNESTATPVESTIKTPLLDFNEYGVGQPGTASRNHIDRSPHDCQYDQVGYDIADIELERTMSNLIAFLEVMLTAVYALMQPSHLVRHKLDCDRFRMIFPHYSTAVPAKSKIKTTVFDVNVYDIGPPPWHMST